MSEHTLNISSSHHWLTLYLKGQHEQLATAIIQKLDQIAAAIPHDQIETTTAIPSPWLRSALTELLENLFFLLLKPDFVIPPPLIPKFISLNPLISNLTAVTEYKTTDQTVKLLLGRKYQLAKMMALVSARNVIQPPVEKLFASHASLTSLWYASFLSLYQSALPEPTAAANLKIMLQALDPRFNPSLVPISDLYYGSTYIDPDADRIIKNHINNFFQGLLTSQRSLHVPELCPPKDLIRDSIGVISACLSPGHAVYKNQRAYLATLKEHADVTLYALHPGQDLRLFHHHSPLHHLDLKDAIDTIASAKHKLLYYPDIGMHPASIALANQRLAPIQVTSYGHSVSTWGSLIDYFIVGEDVEESTAPTGHYSEIPIAIKGLGVIHEPIAKRVPQPRTNRGEIIISCPWSGQKTNAELITVLKQIVHQSSIPLVLRFLVGPQLTRDYGFLPFAAVLRQRLAPAVVELHTNGDHYYYLDRISESNLALDAHHFGGCNSVFDSLIAGVPIVTWRGSKWYNRIGSAMLEAVGLSELIATTADEYCSIALRLIEDTSWREAIAAKINVLDLNSSPLCDKSPSTEFATAITRLMSLS